MKFRCAEYTESMIDGKGIAFVVYFQGCKFNCKGCHNKELQDFDGGFLIDTTDIIDIFNAGINFYDSIVFLGGEPLEQKEALLEMIEAIEPSKEIWLYTGYEVNEIPKSIKEKVNVLIAGKYIEELKTNDFPASSNQIIIRNKETNKGA